MLFAVYLFAIVFVSFCLLLADEPSTTTTALLTYDNLTVPAESSSLADLQMLDLFWSIVPPTEATEESEAESTTANVINTITTALVTEAQEETKEVLDVVELMTRNELLQAIKRRGHYSPGISKKSKAQLQELFVEVLSLPKFA